MPLTMTARARRAVRWCAALLLLMGTALPAFAQGYSCAISPGSLNIAFNAYDPVSATPRTASASVTLTCTHLTGGSQTINWAMQLNNGSSGTCVGVAGRTLRRVGSPTDMIGYNIYKGSVANGVWGNSGCGTYPTGSMTVSNGNPNNIKSITQTLFGQIPINQFAPAGSYTDPLVLTISF